MIDDSTISFIPSLADTGMLPLYAYVLDQDGAADTLSWYLEVLDSRYNVAPEFLTRRQELLDSVLLGDVYTDTVRASDLDQELGLQYEMIEGRDTMSVEVMTGALQWAPTEEDVGLHFFTVQVKDDSNATDELFWAVQVLHRNLLAFSAGEDTTVTIKDVVQLVPHIEVIADSIIMYEWDIGMTGEFVQTSGPDTQITVPSTEDLHYTCILRITLSGGEKVAEDVLIEVLADVPVIDAGKDQVVPPGETAHLQGVVREERGAIVRWEWDIMNNGNFVESDTSLFSFAVDSSMIYECILRVTDDDGNQATDMVKVYSINPKLKELPPYTFVMGSDTGDADEAPAHSVFINGFMIDSAEVFQREYLDVFEFESYENPSYFTGAEYPVESVTWFDAVLYCNKLSVLHGLDTVYGYSEIEGHPGKGCTNLQDLAMDYNVMGYRLPTEAEWEYACRARTTSAYYWEDTTHSSYAWYDSTSNGGTKTAATKLPNAYNLHDMAGNVWEWCNDWYDATYYGNSPQNNPTGPESVVTEVRVIRGGSWTDDISELRSAKRGFGGAGWKSNFVGFRTVLQLSRQQ
ncbi:SUMF1/EgtB/PvdO family nonheme iron enzyme [Fibrobacterota bacterium]